MNDSQRQIVFLALLIGGVLLVLALLAGIGQLAAAVLFGGGMIAAAFFVRAGGKKRATAGFIVREDIKKSDEDGA